MDHYDEEWLTCDNCGTETDYAELRRTNDDSEAA